MVCNVKGMDWLKLCCKVHVVAIMHGESVIRSGCETLFWARCLVEGKQQCLNNRCDKFIKRIIVL